MTTVLVIGFDPRTIPGYDPTPVLAGLERGRARFHELGLDAHECLVDPADGAVEAITAALTARRYDCVVVGGGLRSSPEHLRLFEEVVNLVRVHAPAAEIAFNTAPDDCADAVRRRIP
ncbi:MULTISPECIES: hypothetical protein [unclassified Pseudonocardia]|uniref:hypothetical protein n=1 Tax=unclassified Pseudonocardia TaxID=2619320 RepID=UPI0006CB0656|nr:MULTISPECIES: hypothetical protein [unclassified Pseudonocardia]ALE73961.1 hypothetical protein FRP1_14695 [Pseudonocardia sp. EC080625-04]OLM18003.1 hypothetical protein Ae707Ps1_2262 [Pseudonocardia sp. Ae707_Ps1]